MPVPLDHPLPDRPHRVYVALTNHCNRSCTWCSTYSSPKRNTWLSLEAFEQSFPADGSFEVQLEGGEPTLHPRFDDFIAALKSHPRCKRIIVCTNGVVLPREREKLSLWLARLGEPVTLKLSVNHHLMERDPGLLSLAGLILEFFHDLGGDRLLVINLRRRKGVEDDDRSVLKAVDKAGLGEHMNDFFLQRYGRARNVEEWEPPFLVGENFRMVNPDGKVFGPKLVDRTEALRKLR